MSFLDVFNIQGINYRTPIYHPSIVSSYLPLIDRSQGKYTNSAASTVYFLNTSDMLKMNTAVYNIMSLNISGTTYNLPGSEYIWTSSSRPLGNVVNSSFLSSSYKITGPSTSFVKSNILITVRSGLANVQFTKTNASFGDDNLSWASQLSCNLGINIRVGLETNAAGMLDGDWNGIIFNGDVVQGSNKLHLEINLSGHLNRNYTPSEVTKFTNLYVGMRFYTHVNTSFLSYVPPDIHIPRPLFIAALNLINTNNYRYNYTSTFDCNFIDYKAGSF